MNIIAEPHQPRTSRKTPKEEEEHKQNVRDKLYEKMGKGNLKKEFEKCKHPNSRKIKSVSKKAKRMNNKHKKQLGHAIKSNMMGEKISWFLGQMDEGRTEPLEPQEFIDMMDEFLQRFDEELEQIKIKQSISKNRSNQHFARESAIKMTMEREAGEFNGGGMEFLNLCDPVKFKSLMDWDGNAINIQHLKFELVSRGNLEKLKTKGEMDTE